MHGGIEDCAHSVGQRAYSIAFDGTWRFDVFGGFYSFFALFRLPHLVALPLGMALRRLGKSGHVLAHVQATAKPLGYIHVVCIVPISL